MVVDGVALRDPANAALVPRPRLILGPKFSQKESQSQGWALLGAPRMQRKQMNLRPFYAITQIEYCRNFVFKRHFPIH